MSKKIAVVLFNLGGPDTPEAIRPFLRNLFMDKRIITAPAPIRWFLSWLISTTRAPKVRPLYAEMGGASPILPNTLAQAKALEALLNQESRNMNHELEGGQESDSFSARSAQAHCAEQEAQRRSNYKVFLAMRYWHPFTSETITQIKAYGANEVVLLPLYPQFSTTTTESSVVEWQKEARKAGLNLPTRIVGCYPTAPAWIAAEASLIQPFIARAQQEHPNQTPLILFSAHGLPQKIIDQKGDPYVWQIEQTARAVAQAIGLRGFGIRDSGFSERADNCDFEYLVTYQSRVGPVEWVKPYTDAEIRKAGAAGRVIILVPIAFVSEHIETLVELDVENKHLAMESGCAGYYRVPTVSTHPLFIEALAAEVRQALVAPRPRICPPEFKACICG